MIVEAIDQDVPVFAYSGELTDYHFKRWIDFQAAGPNHVETRRDEYQNDIYSIPQAVLNKLNQWYRGKAYIYDSSAIPEDQEETEGLLETAEKAIKRYGIKMLCIDNLMTAMDVSPRDDLYRAQSVFVKRLKLLAVKYDLAVILVAHPKKSKDRFENDDVSGSADITNRVDIVMNYARGEKDESDGRLSVTKNRLSGTLTKNDILLFYSTSTKRITSIRSKGRVYGWEKGFDRYESELDTLPF